LNSMTLLYQDVHPIAFAQYLVDSFEIEPQPRLNTQAPLALVHDNLLLNGGVNDLVMHPREGIRLLETRTVTFPAHDWEAEVLALRSSTSWRVTAPLRYLRRVMIRKRRNGN
jgi:hypothetical protein